MKFLSSTVAVFASLALVGNHLLYLAEGKEQTVTFAHGVAEKNHKKNTNKNATRNIMVPPKPTGALKGVRRGLKVDLAMGHFPDDGAGVEFFAKEGESTGDHHGSPPGNESSPADAGFGSFSLNGLDPNEVEKGQDDNHGMGSPVPVARAVKSTATPPAASHGDQKASGLRHPAMSGKSPAIEEHPDTLDHPPSPRTAMDPPLQLRGGIGAISPEKQHTATKDNKGLAKGAVSDMFSLHEDSERSGGSVLDPDEVGDVFHVDGGEAGPGVTSARTVTSTRFNVSFLPISGVMSKATLDNPRNETNNSEKDNMLGLTLPPKDQVYNNDHWRQLMESFSVVQLGQDLNGEAPEDWFGFAVAISDDGFRVIVAGPYKAHDTLGHTVGHAKIFQFNGQHWMQLGADIFGEKKGDQSGRSVDMSHDGNTVIIGSRIIGQARIFKYVNERWTKIGSTLVGEAYYDHFGWAVAISGDASRVIVGAPGNGQGFSPGYAKIFQFNGQDWVQLGVDIDGDRVDDHCGSSVDISDDGNIVIIGSHGNDVNGPDSGLARIFKYSNDGWTQMGSDLYGEEEGDRLGDKWGRAVAISGDASRVIVGARLNQGNGPYAGHARIFQFNGQDWVQLGADIDAESEGDRFGTSVDISRDGNTVIIGAYLGDGNGMLSSGYAKIFKYLNDRWTQIGSDLDGEASWNHFGMAVALSSDGSRTIVGGYGVNKNTGHARVFEIISPETPIPTPAPISNPTLSPSSTPTNTPSKTPSSEPSPTPTSSLINFGKEFFHPIGQFTGLDGDLLFGSSVTMSDDGRTISYWGSFSNHTSYIDVFSINTIKQSPWTQLGQRIMTDVDNSDHPVVDLSLSGNGKMLAVATIYVESSSPSGVKVYRLVGSDTHWEEVGSNIDAGSLGPLPGLKVSLSTDGTLLAIGARNYEHDGTGAPRDIGHALMYGLSSNEWTLIGTVTGTTAKDEMGASVSVTGDGEYVAIGATGADDGASVDGGYVKVFDLNFPEEFANDPNKYLVGESIRGEGTYDNSGFSVKLVRVSSSLLKVAIGAIYNDVEKGAKKDAGHVRVFAFDMDKQTPVWEQIGGDMDGDVGATVDYPNFHVGDSLGFSVAMSLDGNRVGMGAPFSSHNRMAGYYEGTFKLFEYNPNINEWEQIAKNIIGQEGGTFGWSIDLSGDGKSIIIGGPASPEGKVQIFYQDEISNAPSIQPSTQPSIPPTNLPSSMPSLTPSVSQPSTQPSNAPSTSPSTLPSPRPSTSPSDIPSITPSSAPSSMTGRTFKILSNFDGFKRLSSDNTTTWCLQAKTRTPLSVVLVRPCDSTNPDISKSQLWYYQDQRIYLKESQDLCIKDEGKQLFLQQCETDQGNNFYIDSHDANNIYVKRSNSNKDFYLVVNTLKLFTRVRLSRKDMANDSWNSWGLLFV